MLICSSRSLGGMYRNAWVWESAGENGKLGQVELVDQGPLSGDSRFAMEAHIGCCCCVFFF